MKSGRRLKQETRILWRWIVPSAVGPVLSISMVLRVCATVVWTKL